MATQSAEAESSVLSELQEMAWPSLSLPTTEPNSSDTSTSTLPPELLASITQTPPPPPTSLPPDVLAKPHDLAQHLSSSLRRQAWDPTSCPEWDLQPPSQSSLARVRRDLATIYRDPPPGMFVAPDQEDLTKIHALIIGPFDTPYEGGFFHFLIRCPPNYPIHPPRVKLLTTGRGTVRFNPNFYANGKVCLSILGTWNGPSWSPALSLSSLLISIQSLMTDKPYHNEPGFESERNSGDVLNYNRIVEHETLRVAVLDNLEGDDGPLSLRSQKPLFSVARTSLPDFLEHYEAVCTRHLARDGQAMRDPFGSNRGKFEFSSLRDRFGALREKHPDWFQPLSDVGKVGDGESDVSDLSDD